MAEPRKKPFQVNVALTEDESQLLDFICAGLGGIERAVAAGHAVRALLDFCKDGRRPVFPLRVVSEGYRVLGGHVIDATEGAGAYPEPTAHDFKVAEAADDISQLKQTIANLEAKLASSKRG